MVVIINRLKLHNFMIFEDVDLDLSGVNLTTIIGQWDTDSRRSNGSGKSALLEAIPYALFGVSRSKAKQGIVREGAEKCVVNIEITVDSKHIRVYRARSQGNTSSAKIWIDGKPAGNQVRIVDQVIKDQIGLDNELFELIYFFRQDEQFRFVGAAPGERKAYLGKIFDLSAIDACQTKAKALHKVAQERLSKAEGACEILTQQLSSMPPYQALLDTVLDRQSDLASLQMRWDSKAEYVNDVLRDVIHARNMLDEYDIETRDSMQKLEDYAAEHVKNISELADLQGLISHDTSLLEQKKELHSKVQERIDKVDVSQLNGLAQKITDKCSERDELMSQAGIIKNDIYAHQTQIDSSSSIAGTRCPRCFQIVMVDHVETLVKEAKKKIGGQEANAIGIDKQIKAVKSEVESLCNLKVTLDKTHDDIAANKRLKSDIEGLTKQFWSNKKRQSILHERQTQIDQERAIIASNLNVGDVAKHRNELRWLIDALDTTTAPVDAHMKVATGAVVTAERNLKDYEDIVKRIGDQEREIEACKRQVNIYEILVSIFGRNGMQAIMVENVIGIIEQFANDMLKQMQTRFVLSLRTLKDTRVGDSKETLEIVVLDNGRERMFETYSGGERTLINLALRLSLSRIISSLHGVVVQSLFLDEVLASLDEVNREEAIKVITFLAKNFEQVFIISHTTEIRDIIDSRLVVHRYSGHSEIRLNQNAA